MKYSTLHCNMLYVVDCIVHRTSTKTLWHTMAISSADMGASKNNGIPKSSILLGFSIIFTIHFGGKHPLFLVQHPYNISCPPAFSVGIFSTSLHHQATLCGIPLTNLMNMEFLYGPKNLRCWCKRWWCPILLPKAESLGPFFFCSFKFQTLGGIFHVPPTESSFGM